MFKKVIGQQDRSEPSRSTPQPPELRHPEPIPVPAPPQHGTQATAARPAPVATRNVLSSDVEIKGTVKFTNDLVVDGKIEGEIFSEGNLIVGENARIKAEVKTSTVIVYGKVHGNLTATDRIELKASAEVIGDIKAKTLSIEAGAIFVGKSTVGAPAQVPAQAPVTAQVQSQGQSQAQGQSQGQAKPAGMPVNTPRQGTLSGTNS